MSGWNGSGQKGAAPVQPKVAPKKPSPIRGIVAGGLVCVLAVGAYFAFFSGSEKPQVEKAEKERGRIKEVTPAAAPKPKEQPKPKAYALQKRYPELNIPDSWDKPYPPQAYRADGSLKRHSRYVTVITNSIPEWMKSVEERTFKNIAERDIAMTLNMEPGDMLVGEYKYGEKFVKDFLESLKTPVEFKDDDTEEQRAMKEWVIEAKKELKAKYDAGEDIAEIMNETRRQYQELGLYRVEIQQMVNKAMKENEGKFTEQDKIDLIKAANLMLEDRGSKPLALPESFVERVTHDVNEEPAKEGETNE